MSDAYEALMSMTDDQAATYSIDPSTEGHIVVGPDRFVTVPESLKRIGVQYDHKIETVTFDCPRYWDGHDMSQMHIYINFRAANGEIGGYIAQNISVDGDIMHFDWTITKDVTQAAGKIAFLVCVKKSDVEGNEENHWNSELCMDMYVSEGLESEPTLEDYDPIVITQLLTRMDRVELINVQADEMRTLHSETKAYASNASMNANITKAMAEEATEAFDFARSSFSNAIKNRVSGEGVRIDDMSPVPLLEVAVTARSRNLAIRTNTAREYTTNGITFVVNGDATITANGTATGTAYYLLQLGTEYDKMIPIKRGHYAMPLAPAEGCRIALGVRTSSDAERVVDNSTTTHKCSFNVTNNTTRFDIMLCVDDGHTLTDVVFKPLLVEGDDAGEYTPYVDPRNVAIMGYGKNILPTTYFDSSGYTTGGITYTVNDDGSIRAVGTATANSYFRMMKMDLTGLEYTLTDCDHDVSNKFTYVWVMKGETVDKVFYPQVELGSTATKREVPKEPVYGSVSEDGTSSIAAIHPTMSLIPSVPGVILDVEYNVDLNTIEFLQGPSAYEVAVKNGFEGTEEEWLSSLSEAGASVKYVYQELTDEQKARARENISVMSQEEINELGARFTQMIEALEGSTNELTMNLELVDYKATTAIKYGAQTLTEEQKTQARKNIDAVSTDDINQMAQSLKASDLGGIMAPETATEGQFLRYIDGVWTASTIASAEGSSF